MKRQNRIFIALLSVLGILIQLPIYAQNLVPNPSFEDHKNIPCEWLTEQADLTATLSSWEAASIGVPDIFSELADENCWAHVPTTGYTGNQECIFGTEAPHSGDFMAGIFTYGKNRRSYLQVALTQPLTIGSTYEVSAWVSLADNLGAASNVQFALSDQKINTATFDALTNLTPVVSSREPITQKEGWTPVRGKVTVDKEYTHLLIGNFVFDFNADFVDVGTENCNLRKDQAYYYIDDVTVLNTVKDLTVTGPDQLCRGEEATLNVSGGANYVWFTETDRATELGREPEFTTLIEETTTFIVEGTIDGTFTTGTFTVEVYDSPLLISGPMFKCPDEELIINGGTYASYQWADGSTGKQLIVNTPGNYALTVTDEFDCQQSGVFEVQDQATPAVNFLPFPSLCFDESVTLQLEQTDDIPYDFEWGDGSTGTAITVEKVGNYPVTITDFLGCQTILTADVNTNDCVCELSLPTAFSPNGDNTNETFQAITRCPIGDYQLSIYDRWGNPIFSSTELAMGWDGTHEELACQMGIYIWTIQYTDDKGTEERISGSVSLLR